MTARRTRRPAAPGVAGEDEDTWIDVYTFTVEGESCVYRDRDRLLADVRTWLEAGEEGVELTITTGRMAAAEYEALPEWEE